ncbi:MAG: 30S ribosomal protein S17 [Lentisphaerae bacterium]|nr:30S ribosomal protein S17 [Lentisphaerota bacterium]
MPEALQKTRGVRKRRKGVVVSRSGDRTVVVLVQRREPHPVYGKTVTTAKRCHTHDEQNAAAVGDAVVITEMRPKSRLKRWRLVEVTQRAAKAAEREA